MTSDDSSTRLDELLRLLSESEWSPVRSESHSHVLQRCAAVRTFDRDLYAAVLSAGLEGDVPALDELVDLDDVEPVPNRVDEYRVPGRERLGFLRRWWADPTGGLLPPAPDGLVEFSARMASWYRARERPLDELYQLLLADPALARERFERLFADLDEQFDLTGCRALLDLLSLPERVPFLPTELVALREDRQRYLLARSMWSLEHWQIGRFLEPPGARERFDALLDGRSDRLLHLCAPGGMGKTMLLRWLIADLCVPPPRRMPCARIDLDLVDPINVCREPWLMLLDLADQLDQQLPQAPFRELLREHGLLRPLLYRTPTPAVSVAAGVIDNPAARDRVAHEVAVRFQATCNDPALSPGGPILLVFDTLEEMLVRVDATAELDRFVDLIGTLRDACPGLRLVLSGRYDLRQRIPRFASRLPSAQFWEVEPFDEPHCRRYLEGTRGITRAELVDVIVKRTEGLPFTLALFADVVQDDPSIRPEDLESVDTPYQVHLIRRVLARIEDRRVRWLLRYGVIPRTLTIGFVREVMLPHLRSGMSGGSDLDVPQEDPMAPFRGPGVGILFPTDVLEPDAELDVADVWARLLRFAGESSWVSETPDHQAVRFHSNVLRPMRRMLEGHAVFQALQRGAIDHFERRAREEPPQWLQWTCEAVYHQFQLLGPAAGEYWRRQLETAERLGQAQWRRRLAGEVLGRDYIDSSGNVRPRADGSPILSDETRARACYEEARVDAEQALARRAGAAHQQWTSARLRLSELDRLPGAERVVTAAQRAWLSAAVMLSQGQVAEAEETVRAGLVAAEPSERLGLLTLAAEVAAAAGRPEAVELFGRARNEAARAGDGGAEAAVVTRRAEEAAHWDRLDEAVASARRALHVADRARAAGVAARLGRLLTLAGEPAATLESVRDAGEVPEVAPGVRAELRRGAALANLALLRPLAALDDCHEAIDAASEDGDPAITAAVHELHGGVLGALNEFQPAFAALEHASRLWQQAGRIEQACRCHVRSALLALRSCGNLRDADRALREARRFDLHIGDDVWLGRWLCSIELEAAHGRLDAARDQVEQLLQAMPAGPAPPRLRVRTAVAALSLAPPEPDRFLDLLVAAASRVTPAAALGVLLGDLSRVPPIPGHPVPLRRLRTMLTGERARGSGPGAPEDVALLRMATAEVDRINGAYQVAGGQLAQAAVVLGRSPEPFVWLRWLEGANRLPPTGASLADPSAFLEKYREQPALRAAFLIELATRQMRDGREQEASRSLARAGREAQAVKLRTHLPARILELSGEIRARAGDPNAVADTRQAAELYARLGDDAAHRRLVARADQQAAPRTAVAREDLPIALTVRLVDDGPSDAAARAARLETSLTTRERRRESWHAPLAAAVPLGHRGTVDQLGLAERLASRPAELSQALGAVLLPDHGQELVTKGPAPDAVRDIHLAVADARLHGVPWELACAGPTDRPFAVMPGVSHFHRFFSEEASARHDWRQLQWSLNRLTTGRQPLDVDGIAGPLTQDALRAFRARRGLGPGGLDESVWRAVEAALAEASPQGPLTVVLLRPTRQREDERARGSQSWGVDLHARYRAAGFEVTLIENPSQGALERWAESAVDDGRVPDLIHISTSLDTAQSTAFLDFAGAGFRDLSVRRPQMGQAEELFATVLDRVMQILGDGRPPVLVLDVARPGARTEAARHLLLRNEFAGQLFSLGSTALLLAIGPARPPAMERIYDIMVPGLAAGRSLAEICSALRAEAGPVARWSPNDLDAVLAFAGTALFAHRAAAGLRRPR